MTTFNDWPPELQRKWREQSRKGGKAASHADKVKAGKAGYAARLKKAQEREAKLKQTSHA